MSEFKNYEYRGNENVVLESTTRRRRGADEPTGFADSLIGHLEGTRMGDRASRARPREVEERLAKLRRKKARKAAKSASSTGKQGKSSGSSGSSGSSKSGGPILAGSAGSVLDAQFVAGSALGIRYTPQTADSKVAYDALLAALTPLLPTVSGDVLAEALDEVIAILRDDAVSPSLKPNLLADVLGAAPQPRVLETLGSLAAKLTDYVAPAAAIGPAKPADPAANSLPETFAVTRGGDDSDYSYSDYSYSYSGDNNNINNNGNSNGNGPAAMDVAAEDASSSSTAAVVSPYSIEPHDISLAALAEMLEPLDSAPPAADVAHVLESSISQRETENRLTQLLGRSPAALHITRELVSNARLITHVLAYRAADAAGNQADARAVLDAMAAVPDLVSAARALADPHAAALPAQPAHADDKGVAPMDTGGPAPPPVREVDLEAMAFHDGGHFLASRKTQLPPEMQRIQTKDYEEVIIPAPKAPPMGASERLVHISELEPWTHPAFPGMEKLNRLQSLVYPAALGSGSNENLLICAPTGAGKTNVAMCTMLAELAKHRNPETGRIDKDAFKIIYIAPMKSLVQEVVSSFSARLKPFGLAVAELSGDVSLTQRQIADTQVIVTTPEKWDVITRKSGDRTYTQLVRLVIIDEIHLLHDSRGPVLESIVVRCLRQVEETQVPIRLVGLSATLPNYTDVAHFLRVDTESGLFHVDGSYRPCPLQQNYIGISAKKPLQRYKVMNEVVWSKVKAQLGTHQTLVFVHSRKDTTETAQSLLQRATEDGMLPVLVPADSASRVILAEQADGCASPALAALLRAGIGIHHAGMSRDARSLVENLFAAGHLQVLVCTATLAWGVNLPAHTVIIKGTQVYSPQAGAWVELSFLDVMQMLGRAGRPSFDTFGEGIVITTASELQYYLSLLNHQLPIESQMVSRLPDALNAELVLGTIGSRSDAVTWLAYTYLYVRSIKAPSLYSINPADAAADPALAAHRADLAHSAFTLLHARGMVNYDRVSGRVQPTALGRVAAHYYISSESMATYRDALNPAMSIIDILRVFAGSSEFKFLVVRREEKLELTKLLDKVPIPVAEGVDDPAAKINVLLQAYISGLSLAGFALASDMVYITQSAGRIFRALFTIARSRKWARVSSILLTLCQNVEARQWSSLSPLRQLRGGLADPDIVRRLERRDFEWSRLYDLSPQELGELVRVPRAGKDLYRAVHSFPRVALSGSVQPLTRSVLRIDLTLTQDFAWARSAVGSRISWWVFVEDTDGESLLHNELVTMAETDEEVHLSFCVPVQDPLPPHYFIRVVSDRYLGASAQLAVSFASLVLPAKFEPLTRVRDLAPAPISDLGVPQIIDLYTQTRGISHLNLLQRQVFAVAYESDASFILGGPPGSGKTLVAELVFLRALVADPNARARVAYMVPDPRKVDAVAAAWLSMFAVGLGRVVVKLTGDVVVDARAMADADLVVGSPDHFERVSRRWRSRKGVSSLRAVIFDDIHALSSEPGVAMEVVGSRLRWMASETGSALRFVGLGLAMANAVEVGAWLGVPRDHVFSFGMGVRDGGLEVAFRSVEGSRATSLASMTRIAWKAAAAATGSRSLVWVADAKQARVVAMDFVGFARASNASLGSSSALTAEDLAGLESLTGADAVLADLLAAGVAYVHDAMPRAARAAVVRAYTRGLVPILVADAGTVSTAEMWGVRSGLVVVLGTSSWDGLDGVWVDYSATALLSLLGSAGDGAAARALVLTSPARKDYYKTFVFEALPIESVLNVYFTDTLVAEVDAGTVASKADAVDWLTWSFLYRRLPANPNYYNLPAATHRDLSDFLSDVVEDAAAEAVDAGALQVGPDGLALSVCNLGMIAAYYGVAVASLAVFASAVSGKLRLDGVIDVIVAAAEFDDTPVRRSDARALARVADALVARGAAGSIPPAPLGPHAKAGLLLRAYFTRLPLRSDLTADQGWVIGQTLRILYAFIDVISSSMHLKPLLAAMEVAQMVVQALWVGRDSPLKQIPHLDPPRIAAFADAGVESVYDLVDMDDDAARMRILAGLPDPAMADLIAACNRYPGLEVTVPDSLHVVGGQGAIVVGLEREEDDDDYSDDDGGNDGGSGSGNAEQADVGPVVAPFYPGGVKAEAWWVVVGEVATNRCLGIKRVGGGSIGVGPAGRKNVKVPFMAPQGSEVAVFVVCDSYVGVDQEHRVPITTTTAGAGAGSTAAGSTAAGPADDDDYEYEYETDSEGQ